MHPRGLRDERGVAANADRDDAAEGGLDLAGTPAASWASASIWTCCARMQSLLAKSAAGAARHRRPPPRVFRKLFYRSSARRCMSCARRGRLAHRDLTASAFEGEGYAAALRGAVELHPERRARRPRTAYAAISARRAPSRTSLPWPVHRHVDVAATGRRSPTGIRLARRDCRYVRRCAADLADPPFQQCRMRSRKSSFAGSHLRRQLAARREGTRLAVREQRNGRGVGVESMWWAWSATTWRDIADPRTWAARRSRSRRGQRRIRPLPRATPIGAATRTSKDWTSAVQLAEAEPADRQVETLSPDGKRRSSRAKVDQRAYDLHLHRGCPASCALQRRA